MIHRKSDLNTLAILLGLVGPVLPTAYAKSIVTLAFIILLLGYLLSSNLSKSLRFKLCVFALFLPGLAQAIFEAPENVIRFLPIFALVAGYPFLDMRIHVVTVKRMAILCLGWLIVTQIFIALGNSAFLNLRNQWYPIENHVWNYGVTESLFLGFGKFRSAGLFYNPNIQGLLLVLYYFVYLVTQIQQDQLRTKKHIRKRERLIFFVFTLIVAFAIFGTGSRTALGGMLTALILLTFGKFARNTFKLSLFWKTIVAGLVVLVVWMILEQLVEGFVGSEGSANIKFQILAKYAENLGPLGWLFGGEFAMHFDADWGYWFGATGLSGLSGLALVFQTFLKRNFIAIVVLLPLVLMGMGNSVFYGLLTGTLAVFLLSVTLTSVKP